MGCKGSKHALHGGGAAARAPEPRRCPGPGLSARHSVALRSSTLGTLSLDRAAAAAAAAGVAAFGAGAGGLGLVGDEAMMKAGNDGDGAGTGKLIVPSRSFGGWCPAPATPPAVAAPPPKRPRRIVAASRVAPRTPNKTPAREPEEINVWELMKGLDDDDGDDADADADEGRGEEEDPFRGAERKARSAPGSPAFDPELLEAFRKALDELTPDSPLPDFVTRGGFGGGGCGGGGDVGKGGESETQVFRGIVRARVSVLQERINARATKPTRKASPPRPPAPPESAGRVVVYLTSLRGIRQTYEDCWSTAAVLRGYGVRVDERDLSMHAGFKDELRAALGGGSGGGSRLPQVFADGRHLGGAEEVRRLHEAGELAAALGACGARLAKGAAGAAPEPPCDGCGGVRFVPCGACSGSCKVFVEDEDGGAFRRCPSCNENGLVRCPVC